MNAVYASARALNQPVVKEGMKNLFSVVTFAFGLREIHDLSKILIKKEAISSAEYFYDAPKWIETANTVVILAAKISIVLSACVSRPGVYLISSLTGVLFSTQQLNRAFGLNTIFAINPYHPRHAVSIAAVVLGLPSAIQGSYKGIRWIQSKYQGTTSSDLNLPNRHKDSTVNSMTLFNTIFSRPTLHIVNQLLHP